MIPRGLVLLFLSVTLATGASSAGSAGQQTRTPPRDSPRPAQGEGALQGQVVAADTGLPLHNAQIRLSSDRLRESRTVRTDAQGAYHFGALPAGRFFLYASKPGYVGLRFGARRPREPGEAVELEDGATARIDFSLPRAGVISGHVVNEYGEPLLDVAVRAHRFQSRGGRRRLIAISRARRTDDRGYYRIFGLLPGSYFISAEPPRPDEAPSETGEPDAYLPTYYPGTPDLAQASPITVGFGEERYEVDFRVIPTRAARISGLAVDSAGRPVTGARLTLVRAEGRLGYLPVREVRVRGDGRFELFPVGPGSYALQVWAHPAGGRTEPEFVSAALTVAGQDVEGLVVRTARGGRASGRIVFEGEPPTEKTRSRVEVSAPLATLDVPAPSRRPQRATPADDLTWTLSGLVGPRFIRVARLPPPWSLKSVHYRGADVTDTPLVFEAEAEASGIDVVVTTRAAAVSGVTLGDNGRPSGLGSVVVFSADEARWIPNTRFVRHDRADRDGRFRIRGLPSGQYLAAATDYLWQGEWTDPEFLEQLRWSAVSFWLADGEQKELELSVRRRR